MKCKRDFSKKKKKIKNMSNKMTTNSQLSSTKPKKPNKKQIKQTTRTGAESQKLRSYVGLSVGRWRADNGGKGTGNKKHK